MSELSFRSPGRSPGPSLLGAPAPRPSRPLRARMALLWDVVRSGLSELWAHKMRSLLTLTLLMLGVFALVVMTSVMDGVVDKISTGFSGLSFDGTVMVTPRAARTSEEAARFAMSPGLRYEDLPRLTAPDPRIQAFLPRAVKQETVRITGGTQRTFAIGITPDYLPWMNRNIGSGRGLTDSDSRRRAAVAVVGATLASQLFGGADPVGRDITLNGVNLQVVGVLAPLQIMSDDTWLDGRGVLMPLETYVDRFDPEHKLDQLSVKLLDKHQAGEVGAMLVGRVRQAHHGIEDVEVADMSAELLKAYKQFEDQIWGWRVVMESLAATVLLVGGVGVLSVMLISFSDRRFEIGLRKAMGASDHQILIQFLLEAMVLGALGALIGTFAGSALCQAMSANFPYGLVVNPFGLMTAWGVALGLSLAFGLYPALRAARLSPMEAMR